MNHTVLSQAEWELVEAIFYYEDKLKGLGVRLRDEADSYVQWIV